MELDLAFIVGIHSIETYNVRQRHYCVPARQVDI